MTPSTPPPTQPDPQAVTGILRRLELHQVTRYPAPGAQLVVIIATFGLSGLLLTSGSPLRPLGALLLCGAALTAETVVTQRIIQRYVREIQDFSAVLEPYLNALRRFRPADLRHAQRAVQAQRPRPSLLGFTAGLIPTPLILPVADHLPAALVALPSVLLAGLCVHDAYLQQRGRALAEQDLLLSLAGADVPPVRDARAPD